MEVTSVPARLRGPCPTIALMKVALLAVAAIACSSAAFGQTEPYKVFETRPVITQGPYLIATGSTTATVVWLTDTPSHSKVRYSRGPGLEASALTRVAEPERDGLVPVGTRHVIHLSGLESGADRAW